MLRDICNLPENADYFFGSGGSSSIIAITRDSKDLKSSEQGSKNVYKYFPVITHHSATRKYILNVQKKYKYEIEVLKLLTSKFINTNKTPHIVEFKKSYYCRKLPEKIFAGCETFMEYLKEVPRPTHTKVYEKSNFVKSFFQSIFNIKPKKILVELPEPEYDAVKEQICEFYNWGEPLFNLQKGMYIAQIEYCNTSLKNELINISQQNFPEIKNFLDILFFQMFYTLEVIKEVYPNFIHKDLFIRNIMGIKKDFESDTYIRYHYKDKIYDVPDNGLTFKINDFGLTQVDESVYKRIGIKNKIIKDSYRDVFALLYDVYNGGNLGALSLYSLIENKNIKEDLDKYFDDFFDVKVIKTLIRNNKKRLLNEVWDKTIVKEFVEYIDLVNTKDILEHFESIFPYDKEHKIVAEYGK